MRNLLVSIAIISLAFLGCKSKEANWVLIKETLSTKVFVDQGSITRSSENVVRVWVKFEFTMPREAGPKHAQRMVSHEEFDCTKKTRQTLQLTFTYTDQSEESSSEKGAIETIVPGTYAESEYEYVCRQFGK